MPDEDGTKFATGYSGGVAGAVAGGISIFGVGLGQAIQAGTSATFGVVKAMQAMDSVVHKVRQIIIDVSNEAGEIPAEYLEKKYSTEGFREYMKSTLSGAVVHIQKKEVVQPVAEAAGSLMANHIIDYMEKKYNDMQKSEQKPPLRKKADSEEAEKRMRESRKLHEQAEARKKAEAEAQAKANADKGIFESIYEMLFGASENNGPTDPDKDQDANDGNEPPKKAKPWKNPDDPKNNGAKAKAPKATGKSSCSIPENIDYGNLYGEPDSCEIPGGSSTELSEFLSQEKERIRNDQSFLPEHKQAMIRVLNQIEFDINSGPKEPPAGMTATKWTAQKLVVAAESYNKFAKEHPYLATYSLSALNVALQSALAGFAGLVNSIRAEATGHASGGIIGGVIGEGIELALEEGAAKLMARKPELTLKEARALVGASLLGVAAVSEGTSMVKQILKHIEKPNVKVKLDDKTTSLHHAEDIDMNKPNVDTNKAFWGGDADNPRVTGLAKSLPDHVPDGRIDYRFNFLEDLENFDKGTSKLHNGPLKEDLYLINYHDIDKDIGFGKDKRTMSWATHIKVANKMPTIEDVKQHLALVYPDWGERNAFSIIRIPKGEHVTFVSGKAEFQLSKTADPFKGGGFQVRFRDFDTKWITETKRIPK